MHASSRGPLLSAWPTVLMPARMAPESQCRPQSGGAPAAHVPLIEPVTEASRLSKIIRRHNQPPRSRSHQSAVACLKHRPRPWNPGVAVMQRHAAESGMGRGAGRSAALMPRCPAALSTSGSSGMRHILPLRPCLAAPRRRVRCADAAAAAGVPLPDEGGSGTSGAPGAAPGGGSGSGVGGRRSPVPGAVGGGKGGKGGSEAMGEALRQGQGGLVCVWSSGGMRAAPSASCPSPPPFPSPLAAATVDLLEAVSGSTALSYLDRFKAPRWLFRTMACLVLGGQVMARIFKGEGAPLLRGPQRWRGACGPGASGKLQGALPSHCSSLQPWTHLPACRQGPPAQHARPAAAGGAQVVGSGAADRRICGDGVHNPGGRPDRAGLTCNPQAHHTPTSPWVVEGQTLPPHAFSDRPQFVREFAKLGLTRSVGGVLALALARELTPVVTSIILAGRVGSAFAAELGTMQARASGGWVDRRSATEGPRARRRAPRSITGLHREGLYCTRPCPLAMRRPTGV
jgi:hypothetical protein